MGMSSTSSDVAWRRGIPIGSMNMDCQHAHTGIDKRWYARLDYGIPLRISRELRKKPTTERKRFKKVLRKDEAFSEPYCNEFPSERGSVKGAELYPGSPVHLSTLDLID